MGSHSRLEYIINHVILPPKLPQEDDSNTDHDVHLLQKCQAALEAFQATLPPPERSDWIPCKEMVSSLLKMRSYGGDLIEEKVKVALEEIKSGGMSSPNKKVAEHSSIL